MIQLCLTDAKVLAAHKAGGDWKSAGMRSQRRYEATLRRAQWREAYLARQGETTAAAPVLAAAA